MSFSPIKICLNQKSSTFQKGIGSLKKCVLIFCKVITRNGIYIQNHKAKFGHIFKVKLLKVKSRHTFWKFSLAKIFTVPSNLSFDTYMKLKLDHSTVLLFMYSFSSGMVFQVDQRNIPNFNYTEVSLSPEYSLK